MSKSRLFCNLLDMLRRDGAVWSHRTQCQHLYASTCNNMRHTTALRTCTAYNATTQITRRLEVSLLLPQSWQR